jgi:hypothetical protein
MKLLTEQYAKEIIGILSCYDRIVITGTLPHICHSSGMTYWLYSQEIRIFDYAKFAEELRNKIRANAEQIAQEHGIEIEHINKKHIRKEDIVKKVIEKRGDHPGMVHIISTMETCDSYRPWHDPQSHKTYLKPNTSKCLHYYFYFIDETLGLCYVRVPTWCPFRLQIYFNGHSWLASELKSKGISNVLIDNAFIEIGDFVHAQKIADDLSVKTLHRLLDSYSEYFCPVHDDLNEHYHWSIMQAEYATDIVFKKQSTLKPLYDELIKTAIHTVKPDNIATFLGRKLVGQYQGELGNRYNIRLEGTRIKHTMGNASIKMYDKFQQLLRIETTVNDVSFFKHYRTVEHRDGSTTQKMAAMKKNIYSLDPLKDVLKASNKRYLEFISGFCIEIDGRQRLDRISTPVQENGRKYKGFNLFDRFDLHLFEVIFRGEFCISGFQNKSIRPYFSEKTCAQISRLLKRLRLHGIIKKIGKTYKYYLTELGKKLIHTALKIREFLIIPSFAPSIVR